MSAEKVSFTPLIPTGGLDSQVAIRADRTPAMNDIDQMFLDGARRALADAGCSAMEFLARNPMLSKGALARRLNRGATTVGLVMAIYAEAKQSNAVRATAKELLTRHILAEFPKGWFIDPEIRASVKLGSWVYDIKAHVGDMTCSKYASAIIRSITVDKPPPAGWKPELPTDPFIDDVFCRYWPIDASTTGS